MLIRSLDSYISLIPQKSCVISIVSKNSKSIVKVLF
jgi:hypothetical protein